MDELIPVVIGTVFGALIWSRTSGAIRPALLAATMLAIGAAATILSGEYAASWLYLLLDLAEAAAGLGFGVVILRWIREARIRRERSSRGLKAALILRHLRRD